MAFNIETLSNKWSEFKDDVQTLFNRALDKTGDTMNGNLIINGKLILPEDPTVYEMYRMNTEAVSKGRVDELTNFIPGSRLLSTVNKVGAYTVFGQNQTLMNHVDITSQSNGMLAMKASIELNLYDRIYAPGYSSYPASWSNFTSCVADIPILITYTIPGHSDIILYNKTIRCGYGNTSHEQTIANITQDIPVSAQNTGALSVTIGQIVWSNAPSGAYATGGYVNINAGFYHGNNILTAIVS